MRLDLVHIEISAICNYKCIDCPVGTDCRSSGFMSFEMFKDILDRLDRLGGTGSICLYHYGETLCHPELERFLEILPNYNFTYILSTNLELLTNFKKELLENIHVIMYATDDITMNNEISFRRGRDVQKTQQSLDYLKTLNTKKSLLFLKTKQNKDQESLLRDFSLRYDLDFYDVKSVRDTGISSEMSEFYEDSEESKPKRFCKNSLSIGFDGIIYICCEDYFCERPVGNITDELSTLVLNKNLLTCTFGHRCKYSTWIRTKVKI